MTAHLMVYRFLFLDQTIGKNGIPALVCFAAHARASVFMVMF